MNLIEPLNSALLPHNTCFGCGLENPTGLQIEVVRDPGREDLLRALFTPGPERVGFPGIVHGGTIFTALDCLSTWVSTLLGPNPQAAWVLRSATCVYHNPAFIGEPLHLSGWIGEHGERWDPLHVRCEARKKDGTLCVEGDFKVVPLTADKLVHIAGIAELPANWAALLSRTDSVGEGEVAG